jgi:hypothetical protein
MASSGALEVDKINSGLVVFLDAHQQVLELKAQSFDHFS